jgi:hypothetical protein
MRPIDSNMNAGMLVEFRTHCVATLTAPKDIDKFRNHVSWCGRSMLQKPTGWGLGSLWMGPIRPATGALIMYMDFIFPYFSIFSWSMFGNRFKHMHDVLCWQEFLNIDPLLSSCAAKWCHFAFLQVEDVLKAPPQWQYHVKVGNMPYIPCMVFLSLLCALLMHLMHTTYVRYIWFRIHSTSFYIF